MIGRKCLGMVGKLFNAEQLRSQGRLTHAGVHPPQIGHPVLKAQWQCLHGVHTFNRNFCHYFAAEIQPEVFLPFSPSIMGVLYNHLFNEVRSCSTK